jgi:Fur family transcriptional regulator, peroxide stress response regulator
MNIEATLQQFDIKPSYQRIKILEFLNNHRIHPNVDQIYVALNPEIHTLSKTTVYNTLKLFVQKGLVQELTIDDNEVRYDIDTKEHGHFKCQECHNIYDFDLALYANIQGLKDFQIDSVDVYTRGICKVCLANLKS